MKRNWEQFVAENVATTTRETEGESAREPLSACQITCHSGGPSHSVTVCRDCPLFVSWHPAADLSQVTVRCWWHRSTAASTAASPAEEKPRRIARGSGLHRIPVLPTCASCGSDEDVDFHPRMQEVPICADCLERSREQIPYAEIGAGD